MNDRYRNESIVFRAFCDENRLRIIEKLREGEKCACDLLGQLDIVQSTLSYHMGILLESGIVDGRKEGKWMYYSLNDGGIAEAKRLLDEYLKKASNCKSAAKCKC
ncbi:MAG: winged helix-turn-helix transcriptional regulator [Clostridia bacterium]|nr:winged helix-turn-helix transcriptional regulator [Clostridia bacterium]